MLNISNSKDVTFVEAKPEDAGEIAYLFKTTLQKSYYSQEAVDAFLNFYTAKTIQELIENENNVFVIMQKSDKKIGFYRIEKCENWFYGHYWGIEPDERSQRYPLIMFNHALMEIKKRDRFIFKLDTLRKNRGINNFLKKFEGILNAETDDEHGQEYYTWEIRIS